MAAGLVSQHQLAAYSNPQAGQAGTASVVLGNDNVTVTGYNLHDADATIHLQSSTLAARPAATAVAAGGKWMTSDTLRLFYSDASNWFEAAYLPATNGVVAGATTFLSTVVMAGLLSLNGASLGGADQIQVRAQPTFTAGATSSTTVFLVETFTPASITINNAYNIHIQDANLGAGTTILNLYGIYIDAITAGSTNYAIYTAGAAAVRFGATGFFGGGVTVAANGISVTGASTFTGQLVITTGGMAVTGITTVSALLDLSAATAGQIAFPSTQNASVGANTLDDYKEGPWTPSVGGNATYTTQVGTYTKIGRLVVVTGALTIATLGTGSAAVISGLPYAVAGGQAIAGIVSFWANLATNVLFLGCYANAGASTLQFTSQTVAGANVTNNPSILGNGSQVIFAISYMAAT